jgi:hypothetical protein
MLGSVRDDAGPVDSDGNCGELSTGEYHAQYERSSGWVWTGGLEARQGVGTQDGGSPLYYLETNSKPSSISTPSSELGLNTLISERP